MGWIEIKKWFREFGGISLVWRTKQISKKEKSGAYEKNGISLMSDIRENRRFEDIVQIRIDPTSPNLFLDIFILYKLNLVFTRGWL